MLCLTFKYTIVILILNIRTYNLNLNSKFKLKSTFNSKLEIYRTNKAEVAGLQVEINRELKDIQIKERKRSRSNMFFKIGTLKNFSNFTGKQLYLRLFLI